MFNIMYVITCMYIFKYCVYCNCRCICIFNNLINFVKFIQLKARASLYNIYNMYVYIIYVDGV